MKAVPLSGEKGVGRYVLVDDGDFGLVSSRRWYMAERFATGNRIVGPYAQTNAPVNGKITTLFMHTIITGWPLVDHIDHDGLNNQRSNLRAVTPSQNQGNRRPAVGGTSRYKGVSRERRRSKWRAMITVNRITRHLGLFASEEEAALAYNAAALELFGEFAYLNELSRAA